MQIKYLILGSKGQKLTRNDQNIKVINNQRIQIPKWNTEDNLHTADSLDSIPQDIPLAIHIGKSNLLVIDFDDELFHTAIKLNDSLEPLYQCKWITQSVGKVGGHFVYRYPQTTKEVEENLLLIYINNPNGKKLNKLDTLYGNTLLYATNEANETKSLLYNGLSEGLTTIPLAIQLLVIERYRQIESMYSIGTSGHNVTSHAGTKLAYIGEKALTDETYLDTLLQIITPRRYKEIMKQSRKKLIANHPDRLPDSESAHLYLVALSGVLMIDESIKPELHKQIISHLNSLFGEPLDSKRVMSIVNRDIQSSSYNYDPDWASKSFIITTKDNEPMEVFMYTNKGQINYMVYNHLTNYVEVYSTASGVMDYISSVAKVKVSKDKLTKSAVHVSIINRPDSPFGYNPTLKTFNTYIWSAQQEVFYNPTDYRESWTTEEQELIYNEGHPRYPTTTLKALESSINDNNPDNDRLYKLFLPFMARKYKTRDHSPLFFIFFGVPHSFKSAVVNGVFSGLSKGRHKTLSVDVLTDKYNDWMLDTDLVLMDEIHHLPTFDRIKTIKAINEITGNKIVSGVRRMHTSIDTKVYPQEITFFLTTNAAVQMTSETRDRRMVVFKSLSRVADSLGMSNHQIEVNITKEARDFAYYLSTQVTPLAGDSYTTNYEWRDETYKQFQEDSQAIEDRVAKALDDNDFESFMGLMIESGSSEKDIAACMYKMPKRPGYRVRLYNTREDTASVPGIFNTSSLDINKLKKLVQTISHVQYNAIDYDVGTSIRTGSRRTEIVVNDTKIPKRVLDILNSIAPIPEDIEIN